MVREKVKKIRFNYLVTAFYLPARTELKAFILHLFKKEGVTVAEVNYVFCSDEYLLKINRDFLAHDTYTDIVTFQYSEVDEAVQSDIYISIDRVRENAKAFQVSFNRELYRVLFHGALHLCGYKDKSAKEVNEMRAKEDYYVSLYVPRETQKRRRSHI
ncbi:MAG: rRNA maturation RNase YbeY [Flavisolibacter sp.]